MAYMSTYDRETWEAGCPYCGGSLRYEDDPMWRRFVCYQCARSVGLAGTWKGEQIVQINPPIRRQAGRH